MATKTTSDYFTVRPQLQCRDTPVVYIKNGRNGEIAQYGPAVWSGEWGMGNGEWGKRKPGFYSPLQILCALSCSSLRSLRQRSCLRPIRGSCGASGSLLGFNSVPKRTYHVLHHLRLLPAVGELVAVRCRAGAYQLQIAIRSRLNRQAAICGFPSPCDLRPSICFQCPRTDDTLTSRYKPTQNISSHAP